ncbi:hypothetical protein HDU97_005512 [Phlyctochytrium planicorne]|nr:hypothetical protein HDU97_005512 [Phlyctochytrium planicorne]
MRGMENVETMEIETRVIVTGVVLASLQLEMMGNPECADVAGYLKGHVRKTIKSQITDDAPDKKVVQQHIIITSFTPWKQNTPPYTRSGRLDSDAEDKTIIGIYKFRRNTRMMVSLREAAIYDSLAELQMKSRNRIDSSLNVLGLFTSDMTEPSTINFDFCFFRRPSSHITGVREQFERIPTIISNLVESTQAEAQPFIPSMPSGSSGPSAKTATFLNTLSLRHIQEYNELLSTSLKDLGSAIVRLSESERKLERVREEFRRADFERKATITAPSKPKPMPPPSKRSDPAASLI